MTEEPTEDEVIDPEVEAQLLRDEVIIDPEEDEARIRLVTEMVERENQEAPTEEE